MKRIMILTAMALAACTPTSDLNPPSDVTRYKSLQNEFQTNRVVIRSFVKNESGKKVEASGAVCSARNSLVGFRNVVTPAVVELPTFLQGERFPNRGKPPVLNGHCTIGDKKIELVLDPTSEVGNATRTSGGSFDPNTGIYSNPRTTELTSRLSPTLPWYYPSITLNFYTED